MTVEDQMKEEKIQYDINREAAKISALSSASNSLESSDKQLPSIKDFISKEKGKP